MAIRSLMMLLALAVTLPGCAQFVVLSYLIGGPPHIEPEFDRMTKESFTGTDVKVAVVCWADPKIKLKYSKIDTEVATCVARLMRAQKINVIEPDYIRAWIDKHGEWETPDEIAKEFEVDYVVEIELASFDLYEPHSATLYRGNTEAYVNVHKMDKAGTSDKIFAKEVNFMFPTKVPRSTYEQPELSFKREYLSRLGEEIGFKFYPSYNGDRIPWAT